jgi:hypothetical protein
MRCAARNGNNGFGVRSIRSFIAKAHCGSMPPSVTSNESSALERGQCKNSRAITHALWIDRVWKLFLKKPIRPLRVVLLLQNGHSHRIKSAALACPGPCGPVRFHPERLCVGSSMARTRSQIPPHVAGLLNLQICTWRDHRTRRSPSPPALSGDIYSSSLNGAMIFAVSSGDSLSAAQMRSACSPVPFRSPAAFGLLSMTFWYCTAASSTLPCSR